MSSGVAAGSFVNVQKPCPVSQSSAVQGLASSHCSFAEHAIWHVPATHVPVPDPRVHGGPSIGVDSAFWSTHLSLVHGFLSSASMLSPFTSTKFPLGHSFRIQSVGVVGSTCPTS